jgi:hypothetical protein
MVVVPGVAPSNRVGGSKMLHDAGMVHRDVRCPLLEVPDRISAPVHDLGDEHISCSGRASRIVLEECLSRAPAQREARALVGRQSSYPKPLRPPPAFRDLPIGAASIHLRLSSTGLHGERLSAWRGATLAPPTPPERQANYDQGSDPQSEHHSVIHEHLRVCASPVSASCGHESNLGAVRVDGSGLHTHTTPRLADHQPHQLDDPPGHQRVDDDGDDGVEIQRDAVHLRRRE